jgi:protein-L-isoaspartate O-methyltransferase
MRVSLSTLLFISVAYPGLAQQFGPADLGPPIPTPQNIVEKMLELGHVKPEDVVYDLGSGDGRIVIMAAQKYGAHAVGVEIRPDLCIQAERKIHELGLDDHVSIRQANVFHVDLSPATVVTMFFLTSSNEKLKPNLEKYLKPGARVVSNQFRIPGWKPMEALVVKTGSTEHTIYSYEIGHTK